MCHTHTHTSGCSRVCTDCSRSATLLQPQILSSPKTARKMQISTQHATRPATGSRQQAACSIRQTGCVGDIHSSFDLYRLATCNMRRCICARWLSSHLPPSLLGPQRVSTDCNQDWLFACARLCEWGRGEGSQTRTSGLRRVLPKRFAAWKTVSLRFVYVCDISRFSFSVCGHFACLGPRNCNPLPLLLSPPSHPLSTPAQPPICSRFAICNL